jgi:hypothetical protein
MPLGIRLILAIFTLLTSLSFAEPSIQRFFPKFTGHKFILLNEIDRLEGTVTNQPFPSQILQESLLQSYSLWQVERTGTEGYLLEVFDLVDASGAYSLLKLWPRFQKKSDWAPLKLSVGNHYRPGEGVFWKGNFLLSLRANSGGSLSAEKFSQIVSLFSEQIPLENLYPVTISHLPGEGLDASSVEFYLGSSSLSMNEAFPEPLLKEIGFVDRIEIAFGRYGTEGSSLFLIGYPTPALAEEYFVRLQEGLQSFFSSEGIFMKRSGLMIALFSGPESSARQVLSQFQYAPNIKWLTGKEQETDSYTGEIRTFFGLLTKTILGTGVFILLIIGAGLVVGLIRYGFIRRFPHRIKKKEMVRLNLDDS